MIGSQRQVEFISELRDDVEIGKGRFDHEYVSSLVYVQRCLSQRLPTVGGVHLVAPAVAELRRRVGGIPEGAVKGRRVFNRIGHDWNHFEIVLIKCGSNFGDPAVHHVRWGDDIGAGPGVGQRCFGKYLQGRIVINLVVDQKSAMTMVGVFTETDIGDDKQFRGFVFQFPDSPLDDPVLVVSSGTDTVLFLRNAEKHYRIDSNR